MKYRRKTVVIDAIQWSGKLLDAQEFVDFAAKALRPIGFQGDALVLYTQAGPIKIPPGDWLIRGAFGDIYACRPDTFDATYEKADEAEKGGLADGQIQGPQGRGSGESDES